MRKYRGKDFWYQIDHRPDQDGKPSRRYTVTCRDCGKSVHFGPSGASDEKIRKRFIHDGWDIGKHINLHLCPVCAAKHRDKPPPQKTPLELLELAWADCSETDRETFALKIGQAYFVNSVRKEITEIPADLSNDDDDEKPADWWLELQKRGKVEDRGL